MRVRDYSDKVTMLDALLKGWIKSGEPEFCAFFYGLGVDKSASDEKVFESIVALTKKSVL